MNPTVLAVLQALITLGPGAIDAINAIIKALHDHPVSDEEAAKLGRALIQAVGSSK